MHNTVTILCQHTLDHVITAYLGPAVENGLVRKLVDVDAVDEACFGCANNKVDVVARRLDRDCRRVERVAGTWGGSVLLDYTKYS